MNAVVVAAVPLNSEQGIYRAHVVSRGVPEGQQELARPPPAPAAPGPNPTIVELTTQSGHDSVLRLKDKFPTSIEDPDRTFGNFNKDEAKKSIHQEYQIINLLSAAGGPIENLDELADKRMAKTKAYNSTLRGIDHVERQAVNELRYTPIAQPQTRSPGLIDRLLRRTGAKS